MTLVKICGITNLEDALMCAESGADALGFNFYRQSPRFIEPLAARQIINSLPKKILTVGVFVNEPTPAAVVRIVTDSGVGAVQLHGDESPEYCRALGDRYVIKVLKAGTDFEPESALEYEVRAIMLDTFDPEIHGGTGRVFDWSIARKTRTLVPTLFLAGGLSPENVRDAVNAVNPYAVDACSALEVNPGKKDSSRVEAFVKAARDL
jgi:phosphoribosylanthranilate isomerase